MVFQLQVPVVHNAASPSELVSSLASLGSEISTYVVAFFVVGQFWLAHHRAFRHIRGHDEGLAWLNFAFLFTISVMPFTSSLMAHYNSNPVAIDLFAGNLMLAALATTAVGFYGDRHHLLIEGVGRQQRVGAIRATCVVTVTGASIIVAWWSTAVAEYLWIALLAVPLLAPRLEPLAPH